MCTFRARAIGTYLGEANSMNAIPLDLPANQEQVHEYEQEKSGFRQNRLRQMVVNHILREESFRLTDSRRMQKEQH